MSQITAYIIYLRVKFHYVSFSLREKCNKQSFFRIYNISKKNWWAEAFIRYYLQLIVIFVQTTDLDNAASIAALIEYLDRDLAFLGPLLNAPRH